ncbi:hypothetical protein MLD38_018933 [Melastoma candidum]|uniref:Uncharacterized protein n=1 Tax=Melastoma candidum TaxID=119954 RepID=A0ACB9QVY2_9MYRT|nr:hypothetical protein MLD38_018933 [Melastoma candidum]
MGVGILEILLVNAKGLGDTDFFGKMDPYVLIQFKSQERKSSVAREQGSNPSWNETFTFRVEYPGTSNGHDKLTLKIMDKDTFSSDDLIGHATIFVGDLISQGAENGTAEMHPTKHRVVRVDGSYCGEIQVGMKFNLREEHQTIDVEGYGGWKLSHHY